MIAAVHRVVILAGIDSGSNSKSSSAVVVRCLSNGVFCVEHGRNDGISGTSRRVQLSAVGRLYIYESDLL